MFLVALTGMAGSGKSSARAAFQALGVPVFDADACAKAMLAPDQPAVQQVIARCPEVADANGGIDRSALAALVFADSALRLWLESLLHPEVWRRLLAWRETQANADYVVAEIPLLTATNCPIPLSRVCVVDAPESVCQARMQERDQRSAAQVTAIFAAQPSRAERLALADDVLVNTRDVAALQQQVSALHLLYQQLAVSAQKNTENG